MVIECSTKPSEIFTHSRLHRQELRMIDHNDIDNGPITSRMHKICCCTSLCCACNVVFQPCRKAVSGNKRRVRKEGFDLDMAYIAPRIIIHGFPAAGLEHMYRNPRLEIKRFMDKNHKDHYKMYNFCCEYGRSYDPAVFHNRVERYPFKDHNTPPLESMAAFANSVKAWLDADPQNVVNMHCKAGKGRAGLMGCVALIRTGIAQSATEALEIYDRERVTNNKGLTVTSQRKFVVFYERLWRECWGVTGNIGDIPAEPLDSTKWVVPEQPSRRLFGIEVVNLPPSILTSARVRIFRITNFLPECIYDSKVMRTDNISLDLDVVLKGNFKIAIQFKKGVFTSHIKLMELLHNTYFMDWTAESIDFGLDQLDTKKKVRPKLGINVMMRLRFVQSAAQREGPEALPNGGKEGYALVSSDGDAGAAALGAEEEEGVEMAPVQTPSTAAQQGSPAKPMPVSITATTTSSATAPNSNSTSSKDKKKGKFSSISSGDAIDLSQVAL